MSNSEEQVVDSSTTNPMAEEAAKAEEEATPESKEAVEESPQAWYRFKGVKTAQGYNLNGISRGAVVMSNIYLSAAFVHLAQERAGCLDENDEVIDDCDGEAYGFKPATFVSNIAVISSVLSALFMPVIGAIVDYTQHRKTVGVISSVLIILIQVIQIGTVQKTWLAMTILQAISGFLYQALTMSVYAYLPDMADQVGQNTMTGFSSIFTMSQFTSQSLFLVTITVLTGVIGATGTTLKAHQAAQMSQAIDSVWSGLFFYYSWKLMESVPARHVLEEGKSLVAQGFAQTFGTVKDLNRLYKKGTRWFFLALIFAEAGANAFTVVAVVYLGEHIGLDFFYIGIFFLVTLLFSLPGSILAIHVNKKLDPKRSYRLVNIVLFFWSSIGAILLDAMSKDLAQTLSFVWGAGIGICLGWFYPTEGLFFSMCLPKGQEAELAGFLVYCTQILAWLPPLIFSIMVTADTSQTYGVIAVSGFLLLAAGIISCAAPWPEILEECGRSPKEQDNTGNNGDGESNVIEA